MKSDRWQQIEQLYQLALSYSAERRAAFLQQACGEDEELRREVESLLAAREHTESLVEPPATDSAARRSAQSNTATLSGRMIGSYKILSLLGQGGMGAVYLAEDIKLGRKVALKFLPTQFTQDERRVHRFEREAHAASALNHPNILTIHEIGRAAETHFIATEFVDGQTLRQRMAGGPMPIADALDIAVQTAGALSAAHEAGIVHRDIKPENIMQRRDGYVKVLDFGLAKLVTPVDTQAQTGATGETVAGMVIGTASYMSPEQAEGKAVDARSDVFSLGVVLYEMLCGRRPFGGESMLSTLASILREVPEQPRRVRHEVPLELERIVLRCLEKKPDMRYRSAGELNHELEACRARLQVRPWRTRLRRPAIVAVVLAVLFGAGALGRQWYVSVSRARWAEKEALPEVARLIDKQHPLAALMLLRQADKYATSSPELTRLKGVLAGSSVSIKTFPAGANIYARDYTNTTEDGDLTGPPSAEMRNKPSPLAPEKMMTPRHSRSR